jgi:hypothetical protein
MVPTAIIGPWHENQATNADFNTQKVFNNLEGLMKPNGLRWLNYSVVDNQNPLLYIRKQPKSNYNVDNTHILALTEDLSHSSIPR